MRAACMLMEAASGALTCGQTHVRVYRKDINLNSQVFLFTKKQTWSHIAM